MMTEHWPAISYDRWAATCDTLHAHTQLLGKLAVELAPPEPELLHAALRLTARGLETGTLPAPDGSGSLVVALDLHTHEAVVEHSRGSVAAGAARPGPAGGRRDQGCAGGGGPGGRRGPHQPEAAGGPVERAARRGPRARHLQPGPGRGVLRRGHPGGAGAGGVPRALPGPVDAGQRVVGVVRPVRAAVLGRPGRAGVGRIHHPQRNDAQQIGVGWWPGNASVGAAFYAFAYPAPPGFGGAALSPAAARWDKTLGEYILDWDDVRAAPDPHGAAVEFLRSAFHHAYRTSGWNAELAASEEGKPPAIR